MAVALQSDRWVVVKLEGDLDEDSAAELRDTTRIQPADHALIIDLTAVSSIDGAGLGALLGAIHRDRERGQLTVVAGARPEIARVLRAAGAGRLAAVVPTVDDAIADLTG